MLQKPEINGIDFLDVLPGDTTNIEVNFIHPLEDEGNTLPCADPPLKKENILIEGGARVKNIKVEAVTVSGKKLNIKLKQPGDFSKYTFRLISSLSNRIPPGFIDPQLSSVVFSFKEDCPNEFDCLPETVCRSENLPEIRIDYLAKDFASFRRLMLDRLSLVMPDWKERNIADLQITLVELLAYAADHLSYYQDAVATEAYLFTARLRKSVRRHVRLLDYHLHNGCNARTWVYVAVEPNGEMDNGILPAGTIFLTRGNGREAAVKSIDLEKKLREEEIIVFESMHDIDLKSSQNEIHFYTWNNLECCLPKGSTTATLYNFSLLDSAETESSTTTSGLRLSIGQVLIFEEVISPSTGSESDADPRHRHAVRIVGVNESVDLVTDTSIVEIKWHEEDALPFALCISSEVGGLLVDNISVARGNIVLADHGKTVTEAQLHPIFAPENENYRPGLEDRSITVSAAYDHKKESVGSASAALLQDPHSAIPHIILRYNNEKWNAKRDLLSSDRFATEFVAEIETDQSVQLRFGDDIHGKKPGFGFQPLAEYRVGSGSAGNTGRDALGRIVTDKGGIQRIRNPLSSKGGMAPETIEQARQFAPEAFRTQERAVTETDYIEKTERHPQVQKALAHFKWTGSWETVFLTIDRKNGLELDPDFKAEIVRHLEKYRLAGYDLEIRPPVFVSLEIELRVCVRPGFFRTDAKGKLIEQFSRFDLPDGSRGYFHPDEFTFGQPVFLSSIYHRAMIVPGVESVEVKTFKKWRRSAEGEIENGVIQPAESEIIKLDNDPDFPENGKIDFLMYGGL